MASGNTLCAFLPQDNEPPASVYATLDTVNSILYLSYAADTSSWAAAFKGVMPSQYAGGGLTIDVFWRSASATSGDVKWDAAYEEDDPNNNDLDSDAFGTASTVTTTTNGTLGKLAKSTITISHANCGSPAAGDPFRLRVRRLAADGADTMTGAALLHSIHVKET